MTRKEYIEHWKKIDKKKIEQWEKIERSINPLPIPTVLEDGRVVCPRCGAQAYIWSKVIPLRPPAFTYFCLKCKYRVNSRIFLEEAEESDKLFTRESEYHGDTY